MTALTAYGRFGGLLHWRFPGNRMANVTVRVQMVEQRAVFHGSPQEDQQAGSIEATYGSKPAMAT